MQILDACAMQWLFRLLVQNSTNPAEKRRLVFHNQEVKQLLEILDIPDDINTLSEWDITLKILQANKEIKVTFDSITYKVTDIANINIFKLFANYTNFIIGRTLVTIFNNLTFFLILVCTILLTIDRTINCCLNDLLLHLQPFIKPFMVKNFKIVFLLKIQSQLLFYSIYAQLIKYLMSFIYLFLLVLYSYMTSKLKLRAWIFIIYRPKARGIPQNITPRSNISSNFTTGGAINDKLDRNNFEYNYDTHCSVDTFLNCFECISCSFLVFF